MLVRTSFILTKRALTCVCVCVSVFMCVSVYACVRAYVCTYEFLLTTELNVHPCAAATSTSTTTTTTTTATTTTKPSGDNLFFYYPLLGYLSLICGARNVSVRVRVWRINTILIRLKCSSRNAHNNIADCCTDSYENTTWVVNISVKVSHPTFHILFQHASCTHTLLHMHAHSLTHSLTHSFTHSLSYPLRSCSWWERLKRMSSRISSYHRLWRV